MIKCPRCNATLPAANRVCQFCGADVSAVSRPAAPQKKVQGYKAPQWVQGAYYSIAIYWILDGLFQVLSGTGVLGGHHSSVDVIIGAVSAVMGLGLVLRLEIIRGIVNFFCGLQIIFGLFGLAGAVLGTLFAGMLGFVMVVLQVLQIATAGFMIYLIGETDTKAPNFYSVSPPSTTRTWPVI